MLGENALARPARSLASALVLVFLVGRVEADTSQVPQTDSFSTVIADLHKGDSVGARKAAATLLSRDPRDARMQLLNGVAYHLAAERGDAAASDLARVGYEASLHFDPNDFWPNALLGTLEFERGNWRASQERFAAAVLREPDDWHAMAGLAAASYYAGDKRLASLAGARVAKLAPREPLALRIAALSAAAAGDFDAAARYRDAYDAAGGSSDLGARLDLLKRTAAADDPTDAASTTDAQTTQAPAKPAAGPPAVRPKTKSATTSKTAHPKAKPKAAAASRTVRPKPKPSVAVAAVAPKPAQPAPAPADPTGDTELLVEVTLILSDDTVSRGDGLNLLQGLQVQFGYSNAISDISGHPTESFTRTITQSIALPQINYSLNLFNGTTDSYWVLSRPTLTAYLGQQSTFFVGHTVHVPVAGVNLGTLESVDAGVGVKLTPLQIGSKKVKFTIAADRSFFDPVTQIQGFTQQISVFKESATATAELNYGQTLILSGLSENVTDSDSNVVPGVSQVPVIGELFGTHSIETEKTSVLILVTPLPPIEMDTPRRLTREGAAAKVMQLWTTLVDPMSDIGAITEHVSAQGLDPAYGGYSRAEQGDIKLTGPADRQFLNSVLASMDPTLPASR